MGKSLFSLSGGEKQRVACASATAPNPPIVVMDEPTSNLDTHIIAHLRKIIKKWKQDRKTVIIAEHRLEWLMDLADRVIYIKNGRIINDYTIEQFKKISKERNGYEVELIGGTDLEFSQNGKFLRIDD